MKKSVPFLHNSLGHPTIDIGVKKFVCIGALPPFDHPHIFLDMGKDSSKICPYCSTSFLFKKTDKNSIVSPDYFYDPEC